MRLAPALFALATAALMAQAPATTTNPKREAHMEKRADRQQKRLARGVKSGELNAKEAGRLERQEAKVDRDMAKAQADGKITQAEAAKIEKEQNRESRRIRRQKHDEQKQ